MTTVTLKGNRVELVGSLPQIGAIAPDFVLTDAHLKDKTLKDFQGKKKIIATVPSLDTETCSLSAKKFNEAASAHPDCIILFVSADLPFAQSRFCNSTKTTNIVTLSMMRSKKFGEEWGVLIKTGPLAGILTRSIFLLDADNRVIYSELVAEITHEPNYEKCLQAL